MKLEDSLSAIIPIESHSRHRAEPSAPAPVPEAGMQFGRPSAFPFSAEGSGAGAGAPGADGDEGTGPRFVVKLPDEGPPEYRRIIRTAAAVIADEARTEHDLSPSTHVDADRFELLRFSFTEYPPKPATSSLQTTYDLRFKLHPETETKL